MLHNCYKFSIQNPPAIVVVEAVVVEVMVVEAVVVEVGMVEVDVDEVVEVEVVESVVVEVVVVEVVEIEVVVAVVVDIVVVIGIVAPKESKHKLKCQLRILYISVKANLLTPPCLHNFLDFLTSNPCLQIHATILTELSYLDSPSMTWKSLESSD